MHHLFVQLSEDKVPDLKDVGVVHVDQFWDLAVSDPVKVDLGTRTTRTTLTHLPEVVFHPERKNSVAGNAEIQPYLLRLLIGRKIELSSPTKVRHIESLLRQFENVH